MTNSLESFETMEKVVERYKKQIEKERELFYLIEEILKHDDFYLMMEEFFEYIRSHLYDIVDSSRIQTVMFLIETKTYSMAKIIPKSYTVDSISIDKGIAGVVARTGNLYTSLNYQKSPHYDEHVDIHGDMKHLTCIPLYDSTTESNKIVFAVMEILTSRPMPTFEIELLQRVGPILSQCLRKSIELHDILLSQRTQAALLHIASASSNEETILKLMQRVIKGASHIVHSESVTLYFIDWPRNELWSLNSSARHMNLRLGLESCLLGRAALSGRMINIKDAATDPRFHPGVDDRSGVNVTSALYVPIGIHHGTADAVPPMAVLECINKRKQNEVCDFTNDDECAFEAFAGEVAVILRRRAQDTEYLKLLVDSTTSESTLQEKAHSQFNLLEAFTSKPCNAESHLAGRLSHSFLRADCTRSPSIPPTPLSPLHQLPPPSPSNFSYTAAIPGWELDVFSHDSDQLLVFAENMLVDPTIISTVPVNQSVLQAFLRVVHDHYHPNPFHNFQHGFSVLHVAYRILKDTRAGRVLLPLDRFACLVAGLCHDIDHPGHSNVYEINSNSPLALLHNDDAVLERHHAATTFRLLQDTKVNILSNFSPEDFRYTRKAIVCAIIGTDMAVHFDTIDALEKRFTPVPGECVKRLSPLACEIAGDVGPWTIFSKSLDDRLFLVKTFVHAADLSAQVFPKAIALKWSNMIAKEFAYQALMESTEGLPVTHVHVDDPLLMVESQHFFAARLVAPLWISLVRFFPSLDHCVINLKNNIAHYEQEILRLKNTKEDSPTNEGQAVAGKNKRTPAKFNSFRATSSGQLRSPLRKPYRYSSSEMDEYGDESVYPLE